MTHAHDNHILTINSGSQVGRVEWCKEMLARHQTYTHEHFKDLPEVRD